MEAKYARPEQERRWLIVMLPHASPTTDARLIDDRYLLGTRLRLRRVMPLAGGAPQYKLGQKIRPYPVDPQLVMHTTMYLTADEYERLSELPGATLSKARHFLLHGGSRFSIDVFQGRHTGLTLAEIELPQPGDLVVPPFFGTEVTRDERFTGGWLAFASADDLLAIIDRSATTTTFDKLP